MLFRRLPWRTFLAAFILSLCVLGLGCAIFIIECHIQQTTHGQVDLGVTYVMEAGVPIVSVDGEQQPTSDTLAALADIAAPPPVKWLAVLWQRETEAAQWLWEQFAE